MTLHLQLCSGHRPFRRHSCCAVGGCDIHRSLRTAGCQTRCMDSARWDAHAVSYAFCQLGILVIVRAALQPEHCSGQADDRWSNGSACNMRRREGPLA